MSLDDSQQIGIDGVREQIGLVGESFLLVIVQAANIWS